MINGRIRGIRRRATRQRSFKRGRVESNMDNGCTGTSPTPRLVKEISVVVGGRFLCNILGERYR